MKYHILSSMLLNEMEKQASDLNTQEIKIAEQQAELNLLRGHEARLAALEARIAAATPSTQVPAGIR